eukprot:scpid36646/ scgid2601/ Hemicentin-1; Fibulin-6
MDLPRRHLCVVVLVIAVWPGLLVAASSSGWTACGAIGGKQLEMKLFTDEKNFADSQNHCAQLGGNLSTVQTDVERKCADSAITTCAACNTVTDYGCGRTCRIWVGLEKTTAGWKWLTHATSLSKWQLKWRSGEPTDDDYQKCGYQYKELSGLGDYSCNNQLSYLCQRYGPVAVDGAWSPWTGYGRCSRVSTGVCAKRRNRTCTNPPPTNGGGRCTGMSQQVQTCNCAVNGGWSSWTSYGHCFGVSEGGCSKQRHRTCTNPTPSYGGAQCTGDSVELMTCSCPVDGGWSTWMAQGACSVSCGGGQQIHVRSCTKPTPAHGGTQCTGIHIRNITCKKNPCPINGKWSTWSPYSACSATCEGSKTRSRSCTDPAPVYPGAACQGIATEHAICGAAHCPIDGKWAAWSPYSACSGTCEGHKNRARTCRNPRPAYNGQPCQGNNSQTLSCGTSSCPVDGHWSQWSLYSQCNATCEGTQVQNRSCNSPVEAYGGKPCLGNSTQQQRCASRIHCPVEGGWSQWSPIMSACSASCGTGSRTLKRSCTMPEPRYGGFNCSGDGERNESCFLRKCTDAFTSSTVSSEDTVDKTTKVIDPQSDAGAMEPAEVGSSTGSKSSSSTFVGLGASIGIGVLLVTVAVILWKKDMLPMNKCLAKQQGGRNEMLCNSRSERSPNHEPSPVPDDSYAAIGADLLNETSFTDTYDVIGNSTAVRPKIKSSGPGKTRQEQRTQNIYTRESTSEIGSRSAEETGGDEDHYDNIGPLAEPPQPVQDENNCCAVGPSFGPAADEDEYDNTHFLYPATEDATTSNVKGQDSEATYDTLQSWPLPETTEQAASTTYDTLCRGDNIQGAQDDPAEADSTVYEAVEAHPKGIGGDGLANPLYDSMLPCTIAATSAHGTSISVSIPGDTIFDETIYDNTLLPAEF